jgi:BOP1NT (NUC169) domain
MSSSCNDVHYCLLQEEKAEFEQADEEDRPDLLSTAFPSLRLVPAYASFIKERFERCVRDPMDSLRLKELCLKPECVYFYAHVAVPVGDDLP